MSERMECDETEFWLDFLKDSEPVKNERVEPFRKETEELLKYYQNPK